MSSKPDIRPNSHPRTGEFVVDELGYLTPVDDAANVLNRETFRDIAWGPHNHEGRDR